jgi:hypothetical protein
MTKEELKTLLIGQRVIVDREIGTVTKIEYRLGPHDGVWVHRHSVGYASCYSLGNVRLLPGGQL